MFLTDILPTGPSMTMKTEFVNLTHFSLRLFNVCSCFE